MKNNETFEKIQQLCESAFMLGGELKDEKSVRRALQEIYTIANEMLGE